MIDDASFYTAALLWAAGAIYGLCEAARVLLEVVW